MDAIQAAASQKNQAAQQAPPAELLTHGLQILSEGAAILQAAAQQADPAPPPPAPVPQPKLSKSDVAYELSSFPPFAEPEDLQQPSAGDGNKIKISTHDVVTCYVHTM